MVSPPFYDTPNGGFRSEYERLTICKGIIVFGGFFWAVFVLIFGFYNYCLIKKPPPAISLEDALCEENEKKSLLSTASAKSTKSKV